MRPCSICQCDSYSFLNMHIEHKKEVINMLKQISGFDINENDKENLNRPICCICIGKLHEFYIFSQEIHKSPFASSGNVSSNSYSSFQEGFVEFLEQENEVFYTAQREFESFNEDRSEGGEPEYEKFYDVLNAEESHLEGRENSFNQSSNSRQFICKLCKKRLRSGSRKGIHVHLQRHFGIKKHSCGACDKSFVTAGEHAAHVKSFHLKLRRFLCSTCGKLLSSKFTLDEHNIKHNRKETYTYQKDSAATQLNLQKSDEQPGRSLQQVDRSLTCSVCAALFDSQTQLDQHLTIFHTENDLMSGTQNNEKSDEEITVNQKSLHDVWVNMFSWKVSAKNNYTVTGDASQT